MPRRDVPRLCVHARSGRAYVTDPATKAQVYLGKAGTPEAQRAYDAWLTAYLARRNRAPGLPPPSALTCDQLIDSYLDWARDYYQKDGKPTMMVAGARQALRHLHRLFGGTPAASFGPRALAAVRDSMVAAGWAREHVNDQANRVRGVFRWAVERELLPGSVLEALNAVTPLRRGRTTAPEVEPVPPVPAEVFEATLPHLPPVVAAMARVQLYGSMRAGEVRIMRPRDLRAEGTSWLYTPSAHKTEHRGHRREVWLGPRAQAVLLPLLEKGGGADRPLFPNRLGNCFTREGYAEAVARACKRAGVPHWSPSQLRHSALTAVRERFGLEGAQVAAGHKKANITEIYAETSRALARRVAEELG